MARLMFVPRADTELRREASVDSATLEVPIICIGKLNRVS